MPTPNTNTNANNTNLNPNPNPNIDLNDPYSTLEAEQLSISQEIPRDPESDIIAKAMQYYNTEAAGSINPSITSTVMPQPLDILQVPTETLYNHDYSDDINAQAEAQLNKLYQQPVVNNSGMTNTATSDILTPSPTLSVPEAIQNSNPVYTQSLQQGDIDPSLVYESVTYPQANFQDYKNTYNPNPTNANNSDVPLPTDNIITTEGVTYVNSTAVDASVINQGMQESLVTDTLEPKSRRWLFWFIGLILVLLLVGLGGYAWWAAPQKKISDSNQSSSSISSTQNSDGTVSSESSRSTRSVIVVFNDPNGPKPADVAKKDNLETITPEFLKQNFETAKITEDKCNDNAICGNDADPDKDGLNNLQEQAYRTDPTKSDSDDDKIADGDEVNIYGIDPTKSDSTNSGYSDFAKIKVCNDPAFKFTNMPNKLSTERQKQIIDNISKFNLHEPTIESLKTQKATDADLKTGTLAESCSPVNIKL